MSSCPTASTTRPAPAAATCTTATLPRASPRAAGRCTSTSVGATRRRSPTARSCWSTDWSPRRAGVLVPHAAGCASSCSCTCRCGDDRERAALEAAAAVVTTSEWSRRRLLERYGLPRRPRARRDARRRRGRARDRAPRPARRCCASAAVTPREGPRRAARRAGDDHRPALALHVRRQPGARPRVRRAAPPPARSPTRVTLHRAARPEPSWTAATPPRTCWCCRRGPRRTAWSSPRRWPAECRSSQPTSAGVTRGRGPAEPAGAAGRAGRPGGAGRRAAGLARRRASCATGCAGPPASGASRCRRVVGHHVDAIASAAAVRDDPASARDWLALREPADAAARASDLVERLPAGGPHVIHDLGAAPARWAAGSRRGCPARSTGSCTTATRTCWRGRRHLPGAPFETAAIRHHPARRRAISPARRSSPPRRCWTC